MNPVRQTHWLIGGVLVLLLAGLIGWSLGAGEATGESEAEAAWDAGYRAGYESAFSETRGLTASDGLKAGANRGKLAGAKTGTLGRSGFVSPIRDFYLTNPIARASAVMAECSALAKGGFRQAAE